jgi:hypothetical protein
MTPECLLAISLVLVGCRSDYVIVRSWLMCGGRRISGVLRMRNAPQPKKIERFLANARTLALALVR